MGDNLNFTVNSKLNILLNDEYYKSNIENVDSNSISISVPIKEGQYLPLRESEQIEAIYFSDKDVYKFSTSVIARKRDRIPIIVLAYPQKFKKIQRRQFVRVPITINVQYSKIEDNIKLNDLKAIMLDLSGGGMKIKINNDLKLKDKIIVYIPIGEEQLPVNGEVVRIEKDELSKLNICGIEFTYVDKLVREKIIKFIFKAMRMQMKKGTLR